MVMILNGESSKYESQGFWIEERTLGGLEFMLEVGL